MNIIITGASRGIGFELAKRIASLGNHNIIAISRNADKLKELKSACIRENVEAHLYPIPFYFSNNDDLGDDLLKLIQTHFSKVDILINNAGYLFNAPLTQLPDAEFLNMVNVNFTAPARLIKLLTPIMPPGSHVVNISSMGGFQGSSKFPGLSVYSATKGALAILTECLAEELKETGIAFNCLALGAVDTEMLAQAFPGYKAPTTASQMAEFIADFALNGNKYFNGKILPVSISTP
jgi:NAD(P)-dependent dehydrogenase (short-subunit alcohol dehydrogenase family)